jgi:hypothetical protein
MLNAFVFLLPASYWRRQNTQIRPDYRINNFIEAAEFFMKRLLSLSWLRNSTPLWNVKVCYHSHETILGYALKRLNSVHAFQRHFFKICFDFCDNSSKHQRMSMYQHAQFNNRFFTFCFVVFFLLCISRFLPVVFILSWLYNLPY